MSIGNLPLIIVTSRKQQSCSLPFSLRRCRRLRSRRTSLAMLVADMTVAFQQTAVIRAFTTIEQELHAPASWTAWLLSGYLIVASSATPLLGKLGDQQGNRRLLLITLVL